MRVSFCWVLCVAVGCGTLLTSSSPVHAITQLSPWITNPANGSQYAILDAAIASDSMIASVKLGGNLATVRSASENDWIFNTFGAYGGQQRLLWTGLTDSVVEGQWRWMSGEAVTYTNWAPGEPNSGNSAEDLAAMYYPASTQGGRWNDWADVAFDPIGLPINAVVERRPGEVRAPFLMETDRSWRAIAPVGDQSGQPISRVALAWETSNPGWNGSAAYSDTAWTDAAELGNGAIWNGTGGAPVYFRKVFELAAKPESMKLLLGIDDDLLVYVNGQLVLSEANGGSNAIGPIDIASLLQAGTNVIAVKAQNNVGGSHLTALVYGTVPEPSVLGLGAAGIIVVRRRQRG